MTIHKVIIHELLKKQGKTGSKTSLSNSLMNELHEDVIELITELNKRYRKANESYGSFDKEDTTEFNTKFEKLSIKFDKGEFIEFTKICTEDLKKRIKDNAPAKGGYLIFAEFFEFKYFLGVFLVRNTVGMQFNRNKIVENFDIDKVQHIDFEKLAMASRINIDFFRNKNERYLGFINKRAEEMSKYFISWIGALEHEDNRQDTQNLYNLLLTVNLPIDSETNEQYEKTKFLSVVHNYILSNKEKPINVNELSSHFFVDENFLNQEAAINDLYITTEFKGHPEILKNL